MYVLSFCYITLKYIIKIHSRIKTSVVNLCVPHNTVQVEIENKSRLTRNLLDMVVKKWSGMVEMI